MKAQQHSQKVKSLAHQIWEQEGRPHGRHEAHWAEAERRLTAKHETSGTASTDSESTEGLAGDASAQSRHQDTPGRTKSASSRQQTQPGQVTQTGSAKLDRDSASSRSSD